VGVPTQQHHDWEPGIEDNGLFWTIPIGNGAVHFDAATGEARLRGESVKVNDFHDFFSAIGFGDATPVPARVSYDVLWHGGAEAQTIRDETYGFVGDFVAGPATITFEAQNEHGETIFRSDAAAQYNPGPEVNGAGSPAVGTERNGVFFS
jgi:hypothetical protein